ncbi:DUF11 domain-containing protein, partial [Candidatus Saccharibacteria bacterium]|nr:DUF11 domain-containing protein [Candidatus Saccharibacteria bacterium]
MLTYIKHFLGNKQVLIASGLLMLFLAVLVPISNAEAGDCSDNSVIKCGITSLGQAQGAYNTNSGGVKTMFDYYGINPNDSAGVVNGFVHKNGNVEVNGKIVATGAWSMGRQSIGNSTQKTINGTTFFVRTTNDSFAADKLAAYVKMVNGQYKWAIVTSCGNPIKAHPTTPVTPQNPNFTIQKKVTKDFNPTTDAAFWAGAKNVSAKTGELVRFTSMTTNTGNVTLNGALSDKLPAGLVFQSGSWQKKSGGVITRGSTDNTGAAWYVLKPGDEIKIDIKAKYTANTLVTNRACTSAKEISRDLCDTATVTPVKTPPPAKIPDFKIVKSVKKAGTNDNFAQEINVNPGQKVEYVIGITNTGNTPLTGMWVRDELPQNVRYVANTTKVTRSYGNTENIGNIVGVGQGIGTIPVGGTAFVFFQATAPNTTDSNVKECSAGKTRLRNLGLANPNELDRKTDDAYINTCKTTPPPETPNVSIDKKVDGVEKKEVKVGQNFTYQVKVTNTGNVDLKNVLVDDVAQSGITLISANEGRIGQGRIPTRFAPPVQNDDRFYWIHTIPSLKVGESKTYTLKAVVKTYKAGDLINNACVDAKEVNPNVADRKDDCDDAIVTVKKETPLIPNVSIDKKVDGVENKEVKVGAEFTYQLVVKNTGDVDLKNVSV